MSNCSLEENVYKMRNDELIGLAKNRFLPDNVQLAIAKTGYTRSHWYLAENEGLSPAVRDFMWSDECNRGYSLKSQLLTYGQYKDPQKYEELYERYPSAWRRSPWRMMATFLGSYHNRPQHCPPEILNRIYDDKFRPVLAMRTSSGYRSYGDFSTYELERLARHPNVDLPLAIKLSTCGHSTAEQSAFAKIVELS